MFAIVLAIVVISAIMAAGLAIHMRIRSRESRRTLKPHAPHLHDIIFATDTDDDWIALPM